MSRRVVWTAAGLAATCSVVLVLWAGAAPYSVLGYPQPDAVTRVATYLLRLVVDASAAICVGGLAFAAFCTPMPAERLLSPGGWLAARSASTAAWFWFAATVLLIPFDGAESIGVPVTTVLPPDRLFIAVTTLYEPAYWIASAVAVLMVALAARHLLRWTATTGLLAVAVLGLLAPVAAGHTASGPDHDLAMSGLAVHVVAAALWLGVLIAVARDARRTGAADEQLLRRYRAVAAGCWVALVVSGVLAGAVTVPIPTLLTSQYGLLVLVKTALLVLIGIVAGPLRRRFAGGPVPPARLVAVEFGLLVVALGVSMGLAQRPPPAWFGPDLGPAAVAFGYDLPLAPTVTALLTTWRVDPLFLVGAVLAAVGYLAGVRRLRRSGRAWSPARTGAWLAGCALLVLATSSGIGAYGPATFSVHMAMHMTVSMLAPLLLVLGAPVALALDALRPAPDGELAGPREWLQAVAGSGAARVLGHPLLVAALFVGSYYLLYLTGLFEAAVGEHWSRMVMNAVGLAIGLLFWRMTVGGGGPRPLPLLGRFGVLFAVMPFHAVLAVVIMSVPDVIAGMYYRTLGLPWAADLLGDQFLGGIVSLVTGEVALLVAQVVVLVRWQREDGIGAFRGGDGEDAPYREMLEELRRSRSG
jgi:cytochrome c oxidase assembly factor CtaG/putative copper export protein